MAFQIVRNDITKIKADAIVNTANPEPVFAEGTDSAVYAAAGAEKLLEERRKIGRIAEGEVAVTPAFDLDAKYIFHTVGPIWQGGSHGEKKILRNCYVNCLYKALELGIESIAFPLIATGVYGFPKADVLQTALSVFSGFLAENELEIILVVFDNESFELSGKIFTGIDEYIDEHYVGEKLVEEYAGSAFCGASQIPFLEEEECAGDAAEAVSDEVPVERERRERRRIERLKRERGSFLGGGRMSAQAANAAVPMDKVPPSGMALAVEAKKRSLEDVVKNISETWSESLLRLITERGYTDTEVYKRANVDRKLFSKIRSNKDYQPKKNTAVAFALALRLNLDETKDFLRRAGYAFSPSSKFDLIIEYSIDHGVYDLMLINGVLFDHDQPQLGA